MIILLISVFAGDYQNLISDAQNFAISGVSSSIPNSPFDNPGFSSFFIKNYLGIDYGYIFGGFSNVLTFKGTINNGKEGFGFLYFNQIIPGIPDTRNALVDLNGNGELDEGEYIDTSKIIFKDAFQNIFLFNVSKKAGSFFYGVNIKIFYENLMGERGIGGGVDFGIIYNLNNLTLGLNLRDFTSSIIIWEDTRDRINPSIVIGSSYKIVKNDFKFMPCFDLVNDEYGFSSLFGVYFSYKNILEILSGMKKDAISFGSGLYLKGFRFHYGLMLQYKEDFPLTHRITLSKCFNKE